MRLCAFVFPNAAHLPLYRLHRKMLVSIVLFLIGIGVSAFVFSLAAPCAPVSRNQTNCHDRGAAACHLHLHAQFNHHPRPGHYPLQVGAGV